jgi:hypothetical protein
MPSSADRRRAAATGHFGRLHIDRALAGSLAHQRLEIHDVAARLLAGAHLDGGGLEDAHN